MITKDVLTLKHSGLCYTYIGTDSPEIKVWLCSISVQKKCYFFFQSGITPSLLFSSHKALILKSKLSIVLLLVLQYVYRTPSTEPSTDHRSVKELKLHKMQRCQISTSLSLVLENQTLWTLAFYSLPSSASHLLHNVAKMIFYLKRSYL